MNFTDITKQRFHFLALQRRESRDDDRWANFIYCNIDLQPSQSGFRVLSPFEVFAFETVDDLLFRMMCDLILNRRQIDDLICHCTRSTGMVWTSNGETNWQTRVLMFRISTGAIGRAQTRSSWPPYIVDATFSKWHYSNESCLDIRSVTHESSSISVKLNSI